MMVKICGITNLDDALAAVEGGASALGFNFWPRSPRYIAPDAAHDLIRELPSAVWKVGVFVDEEPGAVADVARAVRLDVVQLHGRESAREFPKGLRVWKAVRIDKKFDPAALAAYPAEAVLLDGPANGVAFDWKLAAGSSKKVIIAGGLDADNVRQAIEQVRPWGVDACSRLESAPGRKDQDKMAKFLKAALGR
ncbi:MAG TPA: phosphoribosylanthranilate isomerase [Bryobacteraceae bacterium]|nr:phosphoribosylanthranilate isomerase [Bryobacteraceae bacterium]